MHGITKALGIAAGSILFALALYSLLAAPGLTIDGAGTAPTSTTWRAAR